MKVRIKRKLPRYRKTKAPWYFNGYEGSVFEVEESAEDHTQWQLISENWAMLYLGRRKVFIDKRDARKLVSPPGPHPLSLTVLWKKMASQLNIF